MSNDRYNDRRPPHGGTGLDSRSHQPHDNYRDEDEDYHQYRQGAPSHDHNDSYHHNDYHNQGPDNDYGNDPDHNYGRNYGHDDGHSNNHGYNNLHDDHRAPADRAMDRRDYYDQPPQSSVDQRHYSEQPHPVTYPVEFHGKTSEYFKIWIVNVFLTIVTLYIYSAWAKVRTKRYFYGNTTIDNSSFEYHAQGGQLVIGRLIAAALLITYTVFQGIDATISAIALGIFAVMFPWAVWRSLRFNARASSFRNIRLGFDGKALPPYLNLVIIPLIVIALLGSAMFFFGNLSAINSLEKITNLPQETLIEIASGIFLTFFAVAALLVPLLHKNLISYSLNNHRYGIAKFSAKISTGRIYGIYFVTILITIAAFIAIGLVMTAAFWIFQQASGFLDNLDQLGWLEPYAEILFSIAAYIIIVPTTGVAVAYFRSSIRNHRYNTAAIATSVKLNSHTTTWSLWWLDISNLVMLLLSVGLAYPYTKIRSARYFAKRTSLTVTGSLNSFTAREKTRLNALGEEMADAFDVEFDIGI